MRYFKVLYDFVASEAVELTVKKGDVVCCAEVVERDGWIKVELSTDPRRKGFVPVSYLKEQSQPRTSSPHHTASNARSPSTNTNINTHHHNHQQQQQGGEGSSMVNTTIVNSGGAVVGMGMTPSDYAANPAAVVDAFMKNEVFFKQLMKQRQEALSKMEAALSDAIADVASCKDKNAILARKLRDLDQQTEKERRKWKERVEEEKLSIQRAAASAAALYGPAIESRTVRVTDTYSERTARAN